MQGAAWYDRSHVDISSFSISGSTSTDPYSRYLTVECYPGTGINVYTLLNKVVVTGSFSYSFNEESYEQCVGYFSSDGTYLLNLYFILTTYTGTWHVTMKASQV